MRIDGSSSAQARGDAVALFQNNPDCRVALLSIRAAGVCSWLLALSCFQQSMLDMLPSSPLQVSIIFVNHSLIKESKSSPLWISRYERFKIGAHLLVLQATW